MNTYYTYTRRAKNVILCIVLKCNKNYYDFYIKKTCLVPHGILFKKCNFNRKIIAVYFAHILNLVSGKNTQIYFAFEFFLNPNKISMKLQHNNGKNFAQV